MVGHEFLKNELGLKPPKVAWLVDSFGHSAATPDLMQKMGFESLVFSRVSENEKIYRKSQKTMEFMWKPTFESPTGQENSTGLFTHITHELYQGPCGIDLWVYQSDYVFMKNHYAGRLNDHRRNVDTIVNCMKNYTSHYRTNQLMFTIGADFAFQYANLSYNYVEEIVKIVSEHPEGGRIFKFKYSTVQEYITAVREEGKSKGLVWPEYNHDFLPITSNFPGHIWSGYFSSRPNFKQLIR